MSRRSIDVVMLVTLGNGDEGVYKVRKIQIPEYITKMKKADDKDAALEEHADYLVGWLNKAIGRQEADDERSGIMDSW